MVYRLQSTCKDIAQTEKLPLRWMTLGQIPLLLIIDYNDKLRMSYDPALLTLSTSALCNHPLLTHARRLDCTCLFAKFREKLRKPSNTLMWGGQKKPGSMW